MGPFICAIGLLAAAQTAQVEQRLLGAAEQASAAGDEAQVRAHLLAWATLRPRSAPPKGYERLGSEAISQVQTVGHLALFASRVADRIRVGVNDPANLVDRVEAVWVSPDGRETALLLTTDAAAGRTEFKAPPPGSPGTAHVRALMTRGGPPLVVKEARLAQSVDLTLPQAPQARSATVAVTQSELAAPPSEASFPWWWIAGAVAAGALVGAAAWQETR